MKRIDTITVVGGGTAGCIAALMLKSKFPHKKIKIIESSNVGIVGVGESSTEHWAQFCRFVGISQLAAIKECNGTFKIGVYFKNWDKEDFMHNIGAPHANTLGSYFANYAHLISNQRPKKELSSNLTWENKLSLSNYNNPDDSPTNQYHFDTFALNEFLHRECIKKEIEIIEDDLNGAKISENGELQSVISKDHQYFSDFFIDCTGFSRLILNKTFGIRWKSYSDYLPVNSAIAFPTDEMEEYNKYTMATAQNAGWSWTIPTQTRTGNGYVYCDGFIGKEEAHQEMEEKYGKKLEIAREFRFDPGRLEKAWHKNCYAVGLSQSFVEPLEATSIGSVIQQMFCFMHYLPSYDINKCNVRINNIFDNIVDYVQAHYLVQREDTEFWKEVKYNLKLTDSLTNLLDMWKNRLPQAIDISCPWGMFSAVNYIPILYGLNWFDVEKIKEEYEFYSVSDNCENELKNYDNWEKTQFIVSHKELIKMLVKKNA